MAIKLLVIVAFDSVSIACAQLAHHVHTLDPRIVDRSSALGLDLDLLTRFGPEYAGRLKRGSSRTKTKQKKTRRLSPVAAVRASSFSDMDDSLSDYNESEPLVPEVLGEPLYNSPASIEAPLPAAAADEHPASPPNEVRDEGAVAARTSPEVDPHFVRLMEKLVASGKRQGEGVPAQSTLDAKKIAPLPRRARLATGGKQKQHGQAPEVP
ncbi:hypothetical protein PUNSTDRAFT_53371, partial [Punctularia strigosozonata HHB-11173 SS5]|uniref:uncharacterized protein n=1 Tax=Punctularia strigosozonata (strain HHB-11173) TaxID=741275 RepID=UPI0004416593